MSITRVGRLMLALVALLATSTVGLATPAQAEARNGICEKGEFCYFYNSNNAGSVSDFFSSVGNYGTSQPSCFEFRGRGNGSGRCIKNNAASFWNRSLGVVRVYYNSNFKGLYQDILPGTKGNLKPELKNNNASHQYRGLPPSPPPPGAGTPTTTALIGSCEHSGRRAEVTAVIDRRTGFPRFIRYRLTPAAGRTDIGVWVVGRPDLGIADWGPYYLYENVTQDGQWNHFHILNGQYPWGYHWYPHYGQFFNMSYVFDVMFDRSMRKRCTIPLKL